MSKLGLVKNVLKGAKEAKPFYSAADKAAMELTRGKGTGKEFITELKKAPGVKPAELQHRQLAEIEQMPKMTKEQFLKELEKRPPQQIEQTVRRDPTEAEWNDIADRLIDEEATEITTDEIGKLSRYNREEWEEFHNDTVEGLQYRRGEFLDRARELAEEGELPDTPKFSDPDLRLPGGENYREILLRLPDPSKELQAAKAKLSRAKDNAYFYKGSPNVESDLAAAEQEYANAKAKAGNVYRGQHWEEPNVLAHARVQDRVGPNGEKVLHVEEVQSDWHQAGRKSGYGKLTPEENIERARLRLRMDEEDGLPDEAMNRFRELEQKKSAVPDAPFKKNWHELTMKRLLNYAAENGYDKVAITPGAEQAARYDLSKQINRIVYSPTTETLNAFDHSGKSVLMKSGVSPDQLEELIGKDPAQRLLDPQNTKTQTRGGKDDVYHEVSGEDLKVGGEGMQGFYDKMLPDYLNTFGKKYGVGVGKMPIQVGEEMSRGATGSDMIPTYTPKMVDVHSFDITPEMREELKGGVPLYQKIGIPTGAGAAGAELEQPEEPAFAGGGGVFDPEGSDYDYETAISGGLGPNGEGENKGHWGSVTMASDKDKKMYGLPEDSYIVLKGRKHETWGKAEDAERERGSEIVKRGSRYYSIPRKYAAGGAVGEEYDPDQSDGGLVVHDSAAFKRGGKVKISDNPDAMFLELRDKELNRK